MIYYFNPKYKHYDMINHYAVYIGEEILYIHKNEQVEKTDRLKSIIYKMVDDGVLIEENPKNLNIEKIIAKYYLKKENRDETNSSY